MFLITLTIFLCFKGDLKTWLRKNADTNEYETQLERKLKMSVQVVNGLLQYLKNGVVHT